MWCIVSEVLVQFLVHLPTDFEVYIKSSRKLVLKVAVEWNLGGHYGLVTCVSERTWRLTLILNRGHVLCIC